jgi:6-phosphogluconolactonase
MASEVLIQKINIPPENVHPMYCGDDPNTSAVVYETTLRDLYAHQGWPEIDLCLLGMGTDGHTASIFPDSPVLDEETRWVVASHTPGVEHWRLTLTLPVINHARSIAFLVTGADKDETLLHVLQSSKTQAPLPAQLVKPLGGQVHWFLDANAAQRLERH